MGLVRAGQPALLGGNLSLCGLAIGSVWPPICGHRGGFFDRDWHDYLLNRTEYGCIHWYYRFSVAHNRPLCFTDGFP